MFSQCSALRPGESVSWAKAIRCRRRTGRSRRPPGPWPTSCARTRSRASSPAASWTHGCWGRPHVVEAELLGGKLPDGLLEARRRRVAELGFEAVNMPKELGGGGFTAFQQGLVHEQIRRVTNTRGW